LLRLLAVLLRDEDGAGFPERRRDGAHPRTHTNTRAEAVKALPEVGEMMGIELELELCLARAGATGQAKSTSNRLLICMEG
jgi:hypothetical protein